MCKISILIQTFFVINFLNIFIWYAGILQPIDKLLIQEIHVNAGIIRDVHEMRRCLNRVVRTEIFEKGNCPPKSNKRFFPRVRTMRSHMVEPIKKLRHSKIDHECLINKISDWRKQNPHDKIYFRPKGKAVSKNNGK